MLRRAAGLLSALLVALVLGIASPAAAHVGMPVASSAIADPSSTSASVPEDARPAPVLLAVGEPPGPPWPALVGALAALALSWRRPRRALAFALVLLLAVLAFEDGVHSVHHGVDQVEINACAVAAMAAHLCAAAVGDAVSSELILPVVALSPEARPSDPMACLLCSDQGRAPPAPTA